MKRLSSFPRKLAKPTSLKLPNARFMGAQKLPAISKQLSTRKRPHLNIVILQGIATFFGSFCPH